MDTPVFGAANMYISPFLCSISMIGVSFLGPLPLEFSYSYLSGLIGCLVCFVHVLCVGVIIL